MAVRGCTLGVEVGEVSVVIGTCVLFLVSVQVKYLELGLVEGLPSLFGCYSLRYNIYIVIYIYITCCKYRVVLMFSFCFLTKILLCHNDILLNIAFCMPYFSCYIKQYRVVSNIMRVVSNKIRVVSSK